MSSELLDSSNFNGAAELVEEGRVRREIYLDQALFDQEIERIFGQAWVFLGHQSEIPKSLDFRRAEVGRTPVIIVRDQDDAIRVLVNRCAHRGATVCQEPHGNTKFFRCAYHGWTYRTDGRLAGVPLPDRYAQTHFDKADFGLQALPRVDSYRGFIFGSLNPQAPPLREFLAGAAEFIDLFVDLSPDGVIDAHGGVHRYGYDGNWKLQMENGVDGYHPAFTHESFLAQVNPLMRSMFRTDSPNFTLDLGNGHSALDMRPWLREHEGQLSFMAGSVEYRERLVARLGEQRAEEVLRSGGGTGFNLAVFPNLLIIGCQIRKVQPVAVDRTNVELTATLLSGVPDDVNTGRIRAHESFYGPAGAGAPDDVEMFRRVQLGLQAATVPWLHFMRGLGMEELLSDGTIRGHISDEIPQRAFYRQWSKAMNGRLAAVPEHSEKQGEAIGK